MQGELNLDGQPLRRRSRTERLFFAIFPDIQTACRAARFRKQFVAASRLNGKFLRSHRLHVSLHHVGDYRRLSAKYIYAAKQAGNAVYMSSFEVSCRHIASFSSLNGRPDKPLVLICEGDGLFDLHELLGAAMRKNGLRAVDDFLPHMTLLYGPDAVPVQHIEPIRFDVREFALIHSEVGHTRYTVLGRWLLGQSGG